MPTNDDNDETKNAPYKSARRVVRQKRATRARDGRRLTIRSEPRETPDVRKIARAVIAMAVVEAEREAQAQADQAASRGAESAHE